MMVDWAEEKEVDADNIVSFSLCTATELYGCCREEDLEEGTGWPPSIKPKPVKEPAGPPCQCHVLYEKVHVVGQISNNKYSMSS